MVHWFWLQSKVSIYQAKNVKVNHTLCCRRIWQKHAFAYNYNFAHTINICDKITWSQYPIIKTISKFIIPRIPRIQIQIQILQFIVKYFIMYLILIQYNCKFYSNYQSLFCTQLPSRVRYPKEKHVKEKKSFLWLTSTTLRSQMSDCQKCGVVVARANI